MKYYLGIDLGTTGTKSMLFDDSANVVGKGYKGYDLITPCENFFEQNAEDWYDAVVDSVIQATSGFKGEIQGVSVSAQGGSFLLCDIDGNNNIVPLTTAITWMDKRADKEASELYDSVYNATGVKVTKSSVLALLLWLKKNKTEEFNKAKLILSTSDYIYYKLTGKAVIDYTSAAMMGVFDNENQCYDNKLLSFVGLDDKKFPKVVTAGEFIGYINDEFLSKTGLSGKISLYAGLHDQFAASLGSNYFGKTDIIISTGTTWVVFARSDKKAESDYARKHPDGGFGYFSSAVSSGTVLSWEKGVFGVDYKEMDSLASESKFDEKLLCYPFISGNGKYRGDNKLNFSLLNVNFTHTKGDIFKATMEGVSFEIKQIIKNYEDSGFEIGNVIVTGGATRSDIWMSILSDVLGRDLYLSGQTDGCCYGAYSVCKKGDGGGFEKFEFSGKIVKTDIENNKKYQKKFEYYTQNINKLK